MAFYTFLDWVTHGQCPEDIQIYLSVHRSELESPDKDGLTVWHHAASGGWMEILRHLRAAGYAPTVDSDGATAIHSLARCSRPGVDFGAGLDLLMELRVSVNTLNANGISALYNACEAKNEDAIVAMLERGAKLHLDSKSESPLLIPGLPIVAVRRLIMSDSRLVDYTRPKDLTPLEFAVSMNNSDLVTALCDMGATNTVFRIKENLSRTIPLKYVFWERKTGMIIPLLKISTVADLDFRDDRYNPTAIEIANERCSGMIKTILAMFPGFDFYDNVQYPTDEERQTILFDVYFAQSLLERLIVWA